MLVIILWLVLYMPTPVTNLLSRTHTPLSELQGPVQFPWQGNRMIFGETILA